MLSIAMACVGELLLGTATTATQLAIGLALDGTAVTIGSVAMLTARMHLVPRELLGRMTGGFQTVIVGASTIGTLVGGALAKIDLRAPYLVCAAAFFVLFAAALPHLKLLNVSPEADADPASASGSASVPASASTAEQVMSIPAPSTPQPPSQGPASPPHREITPRGTPEPADRP